MDAVNDEEVAFVTFDTFVRLKEDVAIAVTDWVIVSFGCVFSIKADFRVNFTITIIQLIKAEITAMSIVNGSIFFL